MAKKTVNSEFVNPFEAGVSYVDFKKAIPEGTSVEDYCKGNLSNEETNWIVSELKSFDLNNKTNQEK